MIRILLVDDDDALRKMLRLTLVQLGHSVIEARNGLEAMEICAAEEPEVMLTDLIMPKQEGLETIGMLRLKFPAIKVVAMSGGGRGRAENYLKMAQQMGAKATLEKPFSNEELAAALAKATAPASTEQTPPK